MRVLIVAEHASAKFGGEAFLPLNYFRLLRERKIDTWLVVHQRTQAELESLFPQECHRMYFIKNTLIHRVLNYSGRFLPKRFNYVTLHFLSIFYTQTMQRQIVRQLVRQNNIDVVHQPMPVSPKFPSLIFDVGAPVVIGPMNGGMNYPPGFKSEQSWFVDLMIFIGRKSSDFFNRLIPGKLQAKILLVANERTKQALTN